MAERDDQSINDLELSTRAYNCLNAAGITTLGQVRRTPNRELMMLPNFGRVSLVDVRDVVPFKLEIGELALNCEGEEIPGYGYVPSASVEQEYDWIAVIAGTAP